MNAHVPQIIDETQMPPALDQAIRDALCLCFPDGVANFSVTRQWHGSGPEYSAVMQDEAGKVIAHAGVVNRTVSIGGTQIRVAGIQNVCVLPEGRGKGLSDQVMIAAMEEAQRRDYDCGLLFCLPVLEKVYARTGWISVGLRDVIRTENGRDISIPNKNIAMYLPMKMKALPEGAIHLQGNDW